jgi:hypothetical protein
MTSMGNVGSNYGMPMGMGMSNPGVGGVHQGPNMGVANISHMPNMVAPAYANPSLKQSIAPVHTKGCAAAPVPNMAGTVLVLYILLVIILRTSWI